MSALDPHYVTVKQAAEFLAVQPQRVYVLLDAQLIESRYEGTRRKVVVSSLREYAEGLPSIAPKSTSRAS